MAFPFISLNTRVCEYDNYLMPHIEVLYLFINITRQGIGSKRQQFIVFYNIVLKFDGFFILLSKLSIKGTEYNSQYFYSLFNISAQRPLSKYENY